ncbi:MAG: hypothetical protein AAF289_05010 [Cyanobacteria bacterium P01_A01_bin.135]
MNPDNLAETIQTGFRVTLGAASFLAETIQDSQKRDENLSKLRVENMTTLSDEWVVEGARKEEEARAFVESVINSQTSASSPNMPTPPTTESSAAVGVPPEVQIELEVLKTQLAKIRAELEKENSQDS